MPFHVSLSRLASGLTLALGLASSLAAAPDPIEEVGKTAGAWIDTRAETVRLVATWGEDRELLRGTLAGLKDRVERLQEKRAHLLAATATERAELTDLTARLSATQADLRQAEARVDALATRVLRLRAQLPPRLAEALEMSYRSLQGGQGGAGERLQWIVTILNRSAQFNLGVTAGDEVLALPGEPAPKAVETLYWGLSHGYALDRAGGKAWLGTPGPSGWTWSPLEGGVPAVRELLAIQRDETAPRLVQVPARLRPPEKP